MKAAGAKLDPPLARIQAGTVAGTHSDDGAIHIFKGVPYAQAPVGMLRWRPPAPPRPWTHIRDAKTFGPRSLQFDRDRHSISYFGPESESEDCLYLNIWTGAESRNCPVMVWLHGGAYLVGSGALPIFDGEALARRGAVIVTVNYRLGVLGFLAHPELSRESDTGSSGNWGILDQIAALRWIRDNIEAFGGDPARVTIFGQSAGSTSVNTLMASPLAKGLFHRAIAQSGGLMGPLGHSGGGSMIVRGEAEELGIRYARHLEVRSVDELRSLSASQVQFSWPESFGRPPRTILDGTLLREGVYETYRAGGQNDVPLIAGSTAAEGSTRPAPENWETVRRSAEKEYQDCARMVLDCYGASRGPAETSRRLGGHITFNWQNWTQAREHARSAPSNVYAYYFDRAPPLPANMACFENESARLGAFHTSEIPYIFGNLKARLWPWQEVDHRLSDSVASYWLNFAATGDPNGAGLPHWPVFKSDSKDVQILSENIRTERHPLLGELDMWDVCMGRLRERRQGHRI